MVGALYYKSLQGCYKDWVRSRLVPTVIVAGVLTLIGPRLTAPQSKSAGEAFVFEPPAGFEEVKSDEGRKWRLSDTTGHVFVPRVIVTHSPNTMTVEEPDLARIAQGMPAEFKSSGLEWVERRHETRVRPDGARVGLIEADCSRHPEFDALPMRPQPAEVNFRKLQLVFPDDQGTTIVTADFASEEAPKWEPIFEASIAKAKGVATRVPSPPVWMYAGWSVAGLALGWLASSLVLRERKESKPKKEEDES
jgi:hypothetical protein